MAESQEEDEKYQEKFKEMQKFVPFLHEVIEKLKLQNEQSDDKPRQAQVLKMLELLDLITNNKKKLKLETLIKCENVLIKLQSKIEREVQGSKKKSLLQRDSEPSGTSGERSFEKTPPKTDQKAKSKTESKQIDANIRSEDAGPMSPPPQSIEEIAPVEIPTERSESPARETAFKTIYDKRHNKHKHSHHSHRHHKHLDRESSSPRNHDSEIASSSHHHHSRESSSSSHHHDRESSSSHHHHHYSKDKDNSDKRCERRHHRNDKSLDEKPPLPTSRWDSPHSLERARNPSPMENSVRCEENSLKGKTTNPFRNPSPRVSNISSKSHSPEEGWEDAKSKTKEKRDEGEISLSSEDESEIERSLDIVRKFNKHSLMNRNEDTNNKQIFTRLGDKINDGSVKVFENFKVNILNDRAKKLRDKPETKLKLTPIKSPTVVSVPVKTPTIPEVLKSPPLSASDLADLFQESDKELSLNPPSISEIGTRRPPKMDNIKTEVKIESKPSETNTGSLVSPFELVRKKLAMIVKETSVSPLPSPSSSSSTSTGTNVPGERVALKYHPHPRLEKETATLAKDNLEHISGTNPPLPTKPPLPTNASLPKNTQLPVSTPLAGSASLPEVNKTSNPRLTTNLKSINGMPSVNLNDPRIRKQHANTSVNSGANLNMDGPRGMSIPVISNSVPSHMVNTSLPKQIMHDVTSVPQMVPPPTLPITLADPRRKNMQNRDAPQASPPPAVPRNIPVWNSNPGFTQNQKSPIINPNKDYYTWLATRKTQSNQQKDSPPSPEENWDSDLETPPTAPATNSTSVAAASQINRPTPIPRPPTHINPRQPPQINIPRVVAPPHTSINPRVIHRPAVPPGSNFPRPQYYGGIRPPNRPLDTRSHPRLNRPSEAYTHVPQRPSDSYQTHYRPTYGEYRRIKAAEEAAKKRAEEAARLKSEEVTPKKLIPTESKTSAADLQKCPTSESTLDKLYRSSNFTGSEFPKPQMATFKIPKKEKIEEKKADEILKSEENKLKKDDENVDKDKDEEKLRVKKEVEKAQAKVEENAHKKGDEKAQKNCDEKAQKNGDDTSERKGENFHSKGNEKDTKKGTGNIGKREKKVIDKDNEKDNEKNKSITAEVTKENTDETESEIIKRPRMRKRLRNISFDDSDEEIPKKKIDEPKVDDEKTKPIEIKKEPVEKASLDMLLRVETKPARILRRRNTFAPESSSFLYDRDEINSKNALVFEDLQMLKDEQEKGKRKSETEEMKESRKTKNLAEIFQKSDDGCTVSTQNIITGKRRTRTTANFNEVQQTRAVFKHKKPEFKNSETTSDEKTADTKNDHNTSTVDTNANLKKGAVNEKNENLSQSDESTVPVASANRAVVPGKSIVTAKTNDDPIEADGIVFAVPTVPIKRKKGRPKRSVFYSGVSATRRAAARKAAYRAKVAARMQEKVDSEHEDSSEEPSTSYEEMNDESSVNTVSSKNIAGDHQESNEKKILETVVHDLLNSNHCRQKLMGFLKHILSEEKIKEIAEVLDKNDKSGLTKDIEDNEEENDSNQPSETEMETEAETPSCSAAPVTKRGSTKGMKKRNELDRLNEDIRDMFISEGVITATGKRMCTLVAAADKDATLPTPTTKNATTTTKATTPTTKNSVKTPKVTTPSTKASIKTSKSTKPTIKASITTPKATPSMTKVTVAAPTTKSTTATNKSVKKVSAPRIRNAEELKQDSTPKIFKIRRLKVLVKKLASKAMRNNENKNAPTKSGKKIKISKSLQDNDESSDDKKLINNKNIKDKIMNSKPCPKSKKKMYEHDISDSEDEIQLAQLKKRIEPVKATQEKRVLRVKNTNPNWHFQSEFRKMCVVCNTKQVHAVNHYKTAHKEVYLSRLPPEVLEQIKQGKLNCPEFGYNKTTGITTWFYSCPFCSVYGRRSVNEFMEHVSQHTGEYRHECGKCHKGSVKRLHIQNHIEKDCPGAELILNQLPKTGSKAKVLEAHVCELCNYVQMIRSNLETHFIEQHGIKKKALAKMGYVINLINVDGAKKIEKVEEVESLIKEIEEKVKATVKEKVQEKEINPKSDDNTEGSGNVVKDNSKITEDCTVDLTHTDVGKLSASNSNVFMPSEKTPSPTMDEFAKNLFSIDHAEDSVTTLKQQGTKTMSILERLSQKIKMSTTCAINVPAAVAITTVSSMPTETNPTITTSTVATVSTSSTPSSTLATVTVLDDVHSSSCTSAAFVHSENNAMDNTTTAETTNENSAPIDVININDDDDDDSWEDIEVEETHSCATKEIVVKSRYFPKSKRNTLVNKFNKKKRKLPKDDEADTKSNKIPRLSEEETKDMDLISNSSCNSGNVSSTGRPPINLADLLPDSPCNDPIELVPELTPVAPLEDLSDISAILETSCGMPNFLAMDDESQATTSMQEALDYVTAKQQLEEEQMAQNSITISSEIKPKSILQRIQNLGYMSSVHDGFNGFKFYCLTKPCSFMYSDQVIGLENHYLSEHPHQKWKGYCHICQKQVEGTEDVDNMALPIAHEFKHMLESHIAPPSIPDLDNETKPKRLLKVRRFSGDRLSAVVMSDSNEASSLISNETMPLSPQPQTEEPPLFTNMSSDFAITSVCTAKSAVAPSPEKPQMFAPITIDDGTTATVVLPSALQEPSTYAKTASPCKLQISNVCSLNVNQKQREPSNGNEQSNENEQCIENDQRIENETNALTAPLPVILNVCSLSASAVRSAATLWEERVQDECLELAANAEANELNNPPPINEEPMDLAETVQDECLELAENAAANELNNPQLIDEEPMVVAETVPVAQATTGDFLITQTVSTQYTPNAEGELNPTFGFNISIAPTIASATESRSNSTSSPASSVPGQIYVPVNNNNTTATTSRPAFKCMAQGCKYQSRVAPAMRAHLIYHQNESFATQPEYLLCSYCSHMAETVDEYINHTEEEHLTNTTNVKATESLTQKIQSILRKGNLSNTSMGPVKKTYREKLIEAITDIVAKTGLKDNKLYRCVVKGCKTRINDEAAFFKHISYHLSVNHHEPNNCRISCPHCDTQYMRAVNMKTHIRTHARHNLFCYMCSHTENNTTLMQHHYLMAHSHTAAMNSQLLLENENNSYYVVYTSKLSPEGVQQFGERLIAEWERNKAKSKTYFNSNEIDLLPLTPIWDNDVHCIECGTYKTKVRSNMRRHLAQHKASGASAAKGGPNNQTGQLIAHDPINPMPCLNKNEKYFDKMTNLASSSLVVGSTGGAAATAASTSTSTPPATASVPNGAGTSQASSNIKYALYDKDQRYTCGVYDCGEVCKKEETLRQHIINQHANHVCYRCNLCCEIICKRALSVERIIHHTRFHESKLYQCQECLHIHYMKSVVERHIREKHANKQVELFTYVRKTNGELEGTISKEVIKGKNLVLSLLAQQQPTEASPATPEKPGPPSKLEHYWQCNMCPNTFQRQSQMIEHCKNVHGCRNQYSCMHCSLSSNLLEPIIRHMNAKHVGERQEVRANYQKKTISLTQAGGAQTRPLWLRDDPQRIRHIRGILMEDEEEAEENRKRLRLDLDDDDGLEEPQIPEDARKLNNNTTAGNGDQEITANKSNANTNDDNDDDEVSIVGGTDDDSTNKNNNALRISIYFSFSCFHCPITTTSFDLMRHHWNVMHNNTKNAEPFLFKCTQLVKCLVCMKYVGSTIDMRQHLEEEHSIKDFLAGDLNSKQTLIFCAFCNYNCGYLRKILAHYKTAGHNMDDLKNLKEELNQLTKIGINNTYQLCLECSEVFPSPTATFQHGLIAHPGKKNIAFRGIMGQVMYRCGFCKFVSTTEIETLRHMIQHNPDFENCFFCKSPQESFIKYMQHWSSQHPNASSFACIYPMAKLRNFFLKIVIIFPNGFTVSRRNLQCTHSHLQNHKDIIKVYNEMCEVAQRPPIPPLRIGNLRQSIEANTSPIQFQSPNQSRSTSPTSQSTDSTMNALQLANSLRPKPTRVQPQRISKRRNTIAYEGFGNLEFSSLDFETEPLRKKTRIDEINLINDDDDELVEIENDPIIESDDLDDIIIECDVGGQKTITTAQRYLDQQRATKEKEENSNETTSIN